ncbi:hypothetical protein ACFVZH_15800 [Streptomyces sp. NPDC059534]|uniref:hypothetical protein n=1 Tax=Streptomyces sp. NPDC059534 TaxID=3346859 RepID=UPI0036818C74
MHLIHALFRAYPDQPSGPPLPPVPERAEAFAAAAVEHATEHGGWRSGTAAVTLFVRAATVGEAEARAGAVCVALARPPWQVSAVWSGLVDAYYEKLIKSDDT